MSDKHADLSEVRRAYALRVTREAADSRLKDLFAEVPREAFLPPGPWLMGSESQYATTPEADPVHLYQDTVVAIDPAKGINNGQPSLHAIWLSAVAPQPDETVTQIGIGYGYYTAMLSRLAGRIEAIEIEPHLAREARRRLADYANVHVTEGDATRIALPASDVIYVSAGALAPPLSWLRALKPGGRLIFPWRPAEAAGLALVVTRRPGGLSGGLQVKPLMAAWFIPCFGASEPDQTVKAPGPDDAWDVRSLWVRTESAPDDSAVAIYRDVWFSRRELD